MPAPARATKLKTPQTKSRPNVGTRVTGTSKQASSSRPPTTMGTVSAIATATVAATAGVSAVVAKNGLSKDVFVVHVPAIKFLNPAYAHAFTPVGKTAEVQVQNQPRKRLNLGPSSILIKCQPTEPLDMSGVIVPRTAQWVKLGGTAVLKKSEGGTITRWVISEMTSHGIKLVAGTKLEPSVRFVVWKDVDSLLEPYKAVGQATASPRRQQQQRRQQNLSPAAMQRAVSNGAGSTAAIRGGQASAGAVGKGHTAQTKVKVRGHVTVGATATRTASS